MKDWFPQWNGQLFHCSSHFVLEMKQLTQTALLKQEAMVILNHFLSAVGRLVSQPY
jgi:hypothetical protein